MRRVAGVCEDDDELRAIVRDALQRDGLTVRATASGVEAARMFAAEAPDVLVLDVGLPDADGRDVCQALRAAGMSAPVLFLTARNGLGDVLDGYSVGADDYLAKPFALAELRVRVAALLRRVGDAGAHGLRLDADLHAFVAGEERIPLTPVEYRLMAALAAAHGQVVRRAALIAAGWPGGEVIGDGTLDAYLARIRRKLRAADAADHIETARGIGYRLR